MNFFKKLLIKNKKVNHNNKEIQNNKLFEDILFEEYSYCNKVEKYGVKILFITDTHNCLSYDDKMLEFLKNIKEYDVCILLGDHSANDLAEILNVIPKEKIYGVLGNHDSWENMKNIQ